MTIIKISGKHSGNDKTIPRSKAQQQVKCVSPRSSQKSMSDLEQEIKSLRARNQLLEKTISTIQETAEEHYQKKFDLVWFAKNRSRYPNHEKSKFLDTSKAHKDDIQKLKSNDCDYHHGMNCGVLAATRMFKEITELMDHVEQENDPLKKVEKVKESFPDISVVL